MQKNSQDKPLNVQHKIRTEIVNPSHTNLGSIGIALLAAAKR